MEQREFRHHSIPLAILDDLASRFVINLPEPLRNDLIRICFQVKKLFLLFHEFKCPRNGLILSKSRQLFAPIRR